MAMRGRGGGRGNPSRPPRLIVNRVYEEFKPMSEWRQEDGYDTLLLYLPGFQKEYIKVTTEDLNIVRVRGERLVTENKWSRFQEDYRVPENCEMRGIRAKFDGGILTITMPRKVINAPPPSTTTMAQAPPKTEEQPWKPKEETKEKKPDRPQPTRLGDNTLPPPLPPSTTATTSGAPKTEEPRRPKEEPKENKPDKPQPTPLGDNTLPPLPPKRKSSSTPTKPQPLKPAPAATNASLPRGGLHDVIEKPGVDEKTDLAEGKETILKEETKRDFEGSKGEPNNTGVLSGGIQGIVARRGMVNEDRKLLVNVGVGVLIIAALGVHVSYTIGLIGKGK